MGRKLGIDYGSKNVGVALSDDTATLAFPKIVLSNTDTLVDEIVDLCIRERVDTIVVGESTDFSGTDNPIMVDIKIFKEKIEQACNIPVHFEPEFLTSLEAQRHIKDKPHDARAAALILQRYLDREQS